MLASGAHYPGQQPFCLPLQGQDVGPDLFQGPHRLGLVEVPVEVDLVSHPHRLGVVSGVRRVRQHLFLQEGLDAPWMEQGHLLHVSQVCVRLVLNHGGLAADGDRV